MVAHFAYLCHALPPIRTVETKRHAMAILTPHIGMSVWVFSKACPPHFFGKSHSSISPTMVIKEEGHFRMATIKLSNYAAQQIKMPAIF
jgi:hypothetical protein